MSALVTPTNATLPHASPPPRRLVRSAMAVVSGFAVLAALSHLTDLLLSLSGWYPSPGEAFTDRWMYALALVYRCAFAVLGCHLAARLAPRRPMRHALALGAIGTLLGIGGVAASIASPQLGPLWYPLALLFAALPCAWLGGRLAASRTV